MMLKWFDANAAENFGKSLAQYFIAKIPLRAENKNVNKLARKLEAVDQMYLQIEQFKQTNSLNLYKKARLWSTFKDELLAAGYDRELVDQVVSGLMLKL